MIDTIKLPGRQCILNWIGNVGLQNIRLNTDEVLTVTATIAIYNSAGSTILAATAMTIAGAATTLNSATYLLTTGAGNVITAAGTYRMIFTVTYGGAKPLIVEQLIEVKANPF